MKLPVLVLLLGGLLVPSGAGAQFVVHPDTCRLTAGGAGPVVHASFALQNTHPTTPICRVELIPEPKPVTDACRMSACSSPSGSCSLTEVGGANWVLDPSACIGPGNTLAGFEFQIAAGPCCYFISAYGPIGNYLGGYEECFCLEVVQVNATTWGRVKAVHR